MQSWMLNFLTGKRHEASTLILMRGQTFMEAIGEGSMAIVVLLRGSATITRQRAGEQVGLHITPRAMEPVWLTTPGTYCVTARDPTVGLRVLRRAADSL